tara:strand:+ start:9569 stop:9838 length:270 start_codon:yes stop_codon:yes gene_type:complete
MKVQDYPKTIYVREIDDETSKNFAKLKKLFSTNSNNEVVKTLINTYGEKADKLKRSNAKVLEQQREIERLSSIIKGFQFAQKSLLEIEV